MTVYASFLPPKDKLPYIKVAIRKTDTIKVFLQLIWEMKIWDDKTYLAISEKMNKAGQQLGGWHNNLIKENSPTKQRGEKKRVAETGKPPVVIPVIVVAVDIHVPLVVPPVERREII